MGNLFAAKDWICVRSLVSIALISKMHQGFGMKTSKNDAIERLKASVELAFLQFRNETKGSATVAERLISEKFGSGSFSKEFFRRNFAKEARKVPLKTKLAIIAALRLPSEKVLAEAIFRSIVQDPQSKRLTKVHDGFYRYFRHRPNEPRSKNVRWGIVKLETIENDYTAYSHWSFDVIKPLKINIKQVPFPAESFTQPEDTGFAFFSRSKLFAFAFRDENIRLTIADMPSGENAKKCTGIVLTTKIHGGNIFAAGFVMFRHDHARFTEEMSVEEFDEEINCHVVAENYLMYS
jgi:hypothetical protein